MPRTPDPTELRRRMSYLAEDISVTGYLVQSDALESISRLIDFRRDATSAAICGGFIGYARFAARAYGAAD